MRALSQPTTPQKGDTSTLSRSTPNSAKVNRRSRSKSPFRSFRWKRGSTSNADAQSDEEGDEGISRLFNIISLIILNLSMVTKCLFI